MNTIDPIDIICDEARWRLLYVIGILYDLLSYRDELYQNVPLLFDI